MKTPTSWAAGLSALLDAAVTPEIHIAHHPQYAFRVYGYAALVLAVLLALTVTVHQQLSVLTTTGIAGAASATFFGLAVLTKIVLGEERLVYYHQATAVILVVTLALWLFGQPILPYLDVTIVGISMFLAIGRIGCFMVGCCHGRPHRFGVCYGREHADAGFTHYYVGVRLFPIQLVESLWVVGVVIAGTVMILSRLPPGTALGWSIVGYGFGRFFFEFMRGDPARPYWWGFSEGQWTSAGLMLVVAGLERVGALPYEPAHTVAVGILAAGMVAIGLSRRLRPAASSRLLNPRHVREIAHAVRPVSGGYGAISFSTVNRIQRTSLGIQISASRLAEGPAAIRHYTMSSRNRPMTDDVAKTVAGVISTITQDFRSRELLKGRNDVYHLLLRE